MRSVARRWAGENPTPPKGHQAHGRDTIEVRGSTALICSIASFQDHVSTLPAGTRRRRSSRTDLAVRCSWLL